MAKLMAPNIRIDWYPEGHFADPENPTLGELNSGYNLSPAIVTGFTLDFTDSETVDTANIYEPFTHETITHHNYGANLQFFLAPRRNFLMEIPDNPNEDSYRMAEELFYHNQFAKGYLVKRFGYKWNVDYQIGQKIDIFYFQAAIPKVVAEEGNPILLEVLFIPMGMAVSAVYAGVYFDWLGEPHNSYSVKYINGQEVARNIWPNPQFQYPLDSNILRGTGPLELSRTTNPAGGKALRMEATDNLGTFTLAQFNLYNADAVNPGNFLAVRMEGLEYQGFDGGLRWRVGTLTNGSWEYGSMTEPDSNSTVVGTWPIPAGTSGTHARLVLYFRQDGDNPLTKGKVVTMDRLQVAVASTEKEALAQVEYYFDGDGAHFG